MQSNDEFIEEIRRLTADRDSERKLRKDLAVRVHELSDETKDLKAEIARQQSELTKARDLLEEAATAVGEYGDSLIGRCNAWAGTAMLDLERKLRAHQHQSAPAVKDGESGETLCLLCFDKKTVPGPKHGDFVRDCPECCGEEG